MKTNCFYIDLPVTAITVSYFKATDLEQLCATSYRIRLRSHLPEIITSDPLSELKFLPQKCSRNRYSFAHEQGANNESSYIRAYHAGRSLGKVYFMVH